MGFINNLLRSLLSMFGFASETKEETTKIQNIATGTKKAKTDTAILEQKREAYYLDLAEDQYHEDRAFADDDEDEEFDDEDYDNVDYEDDDEDDDDSLDIYEGHSYNNYDDFDDPDSHDNHYSYSSRSNSHDDDDGRYDSHYNDDYIEEFDDDGENYDGYDYSSNYKHKWDRINTNRSWGNSFGTEAHDRRKSKNDSGYDNYYDEW